MKKLVLKIAIFVGMTILTGNNIAQAVVTVERFLEMAKDKTSEDYIFLAKQVHQPADHRRVPAAN